jgi:hypothetical protein
MAAASGKERRGEDNPPAGYGGAAQWASVIRKILARDRDDDLLSAVSSKRHSPRLSK